MGTLRHINSWQDFGAVGIVAKDHGASEQAKAWKGYLAAFERIVRVEVLCGRAIPP